MDVAFDLKRTISTDCWPGKDEGVARMIKEVVDPISGSIRYGVRVTARIKALGGQRIEKSKWGISSLDNAKKIERKLRNELISKSNQLVVQGLVWAKIVESFEIALREGRVGDRVLQDTTVEDTINTLHRYTASWMTKPTSQITPGDVRALMENMRAEGKSLSRCRAVRSAISVLFKWVIENRIVHGVFSNPAAGIVFKKKDLEAERKQPILRSDEIATLLQNIRDYDPDWHSIMATAIYTGMRTGELIALEWRHVDLDSGLIAVEQSYNSRKKRIGPTKGRYWRHVAINAPLKRVFSELKLRRGQEPFVLPRKKELLRGEAAKFVRGFCRSIGITPITFHAQRACFATHLFSKGISPAKIMKMAGWTELKTMDQYVRLSGVEAKGATDCLDFGDMDNSRNGQVVKLVST